MFTKLTGLAIFLNGILLAQAPVISNVRVDAISWTTARVQWNTDIPATSAQVQYDSTRTSPPFTYATEYKIAPTTQAHGYLVGGLAPATTYNFRACSTANSQQNCSTVGSFTTLAAPSNRFAAPALPNEFVVPAMPVTYDQTYRVAADCSDMQTQLDAAAAAPGSGNQLVLLPAAKCLGHYALHGRSGGGTGWIVVRPDVPDTLLPPEGVRIDASWSAHMATLSANAPGDTTGATVFRDADATSRWRFVGVQFTHEAGNYIRLVDFQAGSQEIVFDRCIFLSSSGLTSMILFDASKAALVNSSLTGSNPGTAVVAVDFTYGHQVTIANNYINVPGITLFAQAGNGQTTASDIVIRRNLLEWDPAMMNVMVVRQQFELKQGKRILLDGNTFRNEWAGGETGSYNYTWAFTPRSSDDPATVENSINEISDVTISNNIAHDVPGGFQLYGAETQDVHADVKGSHRWLITNLLMYNLNGYLSHSPSDVVRGSPFVFASGLEDIVISHITVFDPRGTGPSIINWLEDRGAGIKIQNSFLGANPQWLPGVRWTESSTGTLPAIDTSTASSIMHSVVQAAPGSDPTFEFTGNVLIPGVTDSTSSANYSDPTKAFTPAACTAYYAGLGGQCAGSAGTTTANAVFDSVGFNDWRNNDFSLRADSPYMVGADGQPTGANINAISVAQGWVYQPTVLHSPTGSSLAYTVSDPSMQCYLYWDNGSVTADTPGSQTRRVAPPKGTRTWKLFCASGSLPGVHAGETAVYSGQFETSFARAACPQ